MQNLIHCVLLAIACLGLHLLAPISVSAQHSGLDLKYEFIFEYTAMIGEAIEIGDTSLGERSIYPVTGGTVLGPELNGTILPGGADWLLRIDPNIGKLDVRAAIETHEGEKIYFHYNGFVYTKSDGSVYFRSTPVFETASEKYFWLNHTITVGVGELVDGGVRYKVYAIR